MRFVFRFFLAVSLVALGVACAPKVSTVMTDTKNKTTTVSYEATVEVAPGETVILEKTNSSFTFLDVSSDNRCPKGVSCIQAGEAVVRIGLPDGGIRELTVPARQKDLPRFSIEKGIVQIIALNPYPEYEKNIPQQDYRLRLKITPAAAM